MSDRACCSHATLDNRPYVYPDEKLRPLGRSLLNRLRVGLGAPLASRHPGFDRCVGHCVGRRVGDLPVEHAGDDVLGVELVDGNDLRDRVGGGKLLLFVDDASTHVERALEHAR